MYTWIFYATGSAIFAALTTILAKIGLQNINSYSATAIRTLVVLVFAWIMVFLTGSQVEIVDVEPMTWLFLILSGFATGGSWVCYFRALQLGSVNKVVPIDKSSTILTMILAFIFLAEPIGILTAFGMVLMALGTWLMLELKKDDGESGSRKWLVFAVLAAVFAALTAILGRVGIVGVEANLGTAIRTVAVVPMSWLMVAITRNSAEKSAKIDVKGWVFLVLSGVATGASWLFFYRALQLGNASQVVPIDKLSIAFTMGFSALFLGERFSLRTTVGLLLLIVGTLLPILIA
ncbi:MAG: EamA family transporter [Defluviitaleaceae bacterium]|nr:EamA family transporter [Defluviitaleaceae bacterium]